MAFIHGTSFFCNIFLSTLCHSFKVTSKCNLAEVRCLQEIWKKLISNPAYLDIPSLSFRMSYLLKYYIPFFIHYIQSFMCFSLHMSWDMYFILYHGIEEKVDKLENEQIYWTVIVKCRSSLIFPFYQDVIIYCYHVVLLHAITFQVSIICFILFQITSNFCLTFSDFSFGGGSTTGTAQTAPGDRIIR